MEPGIFSNRSFSSKAVVFVLLIVAGFCLATLIVKIILLASNTETGQMTELSGQTLRVVQTLQSIFVFIIPALLFAWICCTRPIEYLYFEKKNKAFVIIFVAAACIVVIPFINWLAHVNEQMSFPDALSGVEHQMQKSETANRVAMNNMLRTDSPGILLYNIFLIGVLAAVGEELLFRGVIQRLIADASKNIHLGIWVSAFVFSAIHFQFYGFVPRLFLGAWFGYLLYWSKSLWIPILAHFVNNTIAVVISYLQQRKIVDPLADTIGKENMALSGISVIVFGFFAWMIYRSTKQPNLS